MLATMTAMTTTQVAERSETLFQQGFCCAESVLQAIAESQGIKSELIPKIATGLCGGIGRTGGVCGAVSGGVLGINLVAGRSLASQSPEANHRLVRALLSEFEAKFGTTTCERLIGCRLDTLEGQRLFKENKLREQKCQMFTKEAAGMAIAILEQASREQGGQGRSLALPAALDTTRLRTGVLTCCRKPLIEDSFVNQNRCAAQPQSDEPKPGTGTPRHFHRSSPAAPLFQPDDAGLR